MGLESDCLAHPAFDSFAQLAQPAFKKVVSSFNEDQLLRFRDGRKQLLQLWTGTKLIARSADEKFWLWAARQESVVVATLIDRSDGRSQADQSLHTRVGTGSGQTDCGPKRKSGENEGTSVFLFEPIQGNANIIHFSISVIMLALAQSGAAEIEAEHGESETVQSFHGMKHDLVVQSSAIKRMRMADESGVAGILGTDVEQGFELPCRAV